MTNEEKIEKIKNNKISFMKKEQNHELLVIIAEELIKLNHYFENERLNKILNINTKVR